jgi:hypothetical protein
MTKSDDFFDISGAAQAPADGSPSTVDFDVFGSDAPTAENADSDLMQTALLPNSAAPEMDLTLDEDDASPTPVSAPAPAPKTTPISFPDAPPPTTGGSMRWIALGLLALLGVAAWWLLR